MSESPEQASPPRRRHTIVLSDVHLSQAHPPDPADPSWMRYRASAYHPDAEYAGLIDFLLREYRGDAIEVVWNGDVLDFDAPWVKDGESSFDEYPLTEEGCASHVRRIMADHPGWFRATARLLLAGHKLIVLSGNHDVELYWPAVRRAIREELGRLSEIEAEAMGEPMRAKAVDLTAMVCFRAWFHITESRIYLEHGSQYDMFNGVRYAMIPVTRSRDWIHPQMGKLAFKRTGSRMGYFNPYYEETFYMGLKGYLGHFYRYYARSHRHLFRTWFMGSLRTALEIWRHRHDEDWWPEARELAHAETGVSYEALDATFALTARSAERWMIPILRELWLDRLFIAGVILVSALIALAIGGGSAALFVAAVLGALFVLYEIVTPKPDIRTYDSAPPSVLRLFEIHGVKAICMGHTHRPFSLWQDGSDGVPRLYANSGSWCPAFHDQECTQRVLPARPLLLLTTEDGEVGGGLYWWDGTALSPERGKVRSPSAIDYFAPSRIRLMQ